jgi:hypothetical protein
MSSVADAERGMDLLGALVRTPGVPGREARIRSIIEAELCARDLVDELRIDAMGSLVGRCGPRPAGRGHDGRDLHQENRRAPGLRDRSASGRDPAAMRRMPQMKMLLVTIILAGVLVAVPTRQAWGGSQR